MHASMFDLLLIISGYGILTTMIVIVARQFLWVARAILMRHQLAPRQDAEWVRALGAETLRTRDERMRTLDAWDTITDRMGSPSPVAQYAPGILKIFTAVLRAAVYLWWRFARIWWIIFMVI